MLSKIWVWDPPGSEIRGTEKTYSGSQIQGSKRHRIRNTGSVDPHPDPESGSGSGRAKNDPQNRKSSEILRFDVMDVLF
jgi:hypothetical protein